MTDNEGFEIIYVSKLIHKDIAIPVRDLLNCFKPLKQFVVKIIRSEHGHNVYGKGIESKLDPNEFADIAPRESNLPYPVYIPVHMFDEEKLWNAELYVLDKSMFNTVSDEQYATGFTYSIYRKTTSS